MNEAIFLFACQSLKQGHGVGDVGWVLHADVYMCIYTYMQLPSAMIQHCQPHNTIQQPTILIPNMKPQENAMTNHIIMIISRYSSTN